MIKDFIFISASTLVKLAAKGLNTEVFGCDTLDQAIAGCRAKFQAGE